MLGESEGMSLSPICVFVSCCFRCFGCFICESMDFAISIP